MTRAADVTLITIELVDGRWEAIAWTGDLERAGEGYGQTADDAFRSVEARLRRPGQRRRRRARREGVA